MNKITEEELAELKYYWEEKEDLERYSEFESIKEDLQEEYSNLLKAWENYKYAKHILNLEFNTI